MGQTAQNLEESSWVSEGFSLIEKSANGLSQSPWHQLRKQAFSAFSKLGFPQSGSEEWKYTNISPLLQTGFTLASATPAAVKPEYLAKLPLAQEETIKLIFVDGVFSEQHSTRDLPNGLSITNLGKVLHAKGSVGAEAQILDQHLARYEGWKTNSFAALNTAFMQDAALVHIAKGAVIELPIHLISIASSTGARILLAPRAIIVAEENSQASIVETFVGKPEGQSLTCAVTEIRAARGSNIQHYKLQLESSKAIHVGQLDIHLEKDCQFSTHTINFGSAVARNEISPILDGEGINLILNGLTVLADEQHVDNHTIIDHSKPRCESREIFKGIYSDKSKGVFSGTIIVRPDAQKTNAIQSNKSLLLSDSATIDSMPQLKIWADDVKCTHGATIGQLDDNAIFYLRSRGIPLKTARAMLVYAFASELISGIALPSLRVLLEEMLSDKLAH